MVEKDEPKRIKLFRIDDRSKTTLESYIIKSVDRNTRIYKDCWKGYIGLRHLFNTHSTLNHSKYFKDPITNVHTNTIEGNWGAVKRQIPTSKRTTKSIDLYLVRFMLLRNENGHPLHRLLKYSY